MEKWQNVEGISTDNTRQKSQGRQNKVLVGLYGKVAELAIILKLLIHSVNNENIWELFIITEKFFFFFKGVPFMLPNESSMLSFSQETQGFFKA